MEYLLRGTDMAGDPVEVHVATCWRCWCLVNLNVGTMEDHVEKCSPTRSGARHALNDDRRTTH